MSNQKWIIKNKEGQLKGPFTTEQVLNFISEGKLSGEEFISKYPGSDWHPISQDLEFYDKLLDVLVEDSEEVKDLSDESNFETSVLNDDATPPPEFSDESGFKNNNEPPPTDSIVENGSEPAIEVEPEVVREDTQQTQFGTNARGEEEPTVEENNKDKSKADKNTNANRKIKGKRKSKSKKGAEKANFKGNKDYIELKEQSELDKKTKTKAGRKPFLIALAVVGVLFAWLFSSDENKSTRIKLVAPKIKKKQETLVEKSILTQGVNAYLLDTFPGYITAQDSFNIYLESYPKDTEAWALQCLTYLELWPYSYQDSDDLKVAAFALRKSAALDPSGINSSTCKAVNYILKNENQEALAVVSGILDSFSGGGGKPPIVFYYLKALLLADPLTIKSAISYSRSAQNLWPNWLRAYVLEAKLRVMKGEYSTGATIYKNVLKANPDHTVSRIELGIIEYRFLNHAQEGFEILMEAFSINDKVPPKIASEGMVTLAEILAKANDPDEALEYASKAYSLDPGNKSAQNLVLRLGGKDKLSEVEVDVRNLVSEGDQFFRLSEWESAYAQYKTAYELDNKNAIAAMRAGKAAWKMNSSLLAISWLDKAILADYKLMDAYISLAILYAKRYDFASAGKILNKANKVSANNYEVYRGYAEIELIRRSPSTAITFGKKAEALYPTDTDTHIILAKAYLRTQKYREAFESGSKAIEVDPNSKEAQIIYAKAIAGLEGVDTGISYLARIVENYPLVSEYRIGLGEIYLEDERFNEAIRVFSDVIRINKRSHKAYMSLGRAYKRYGQLQFSLEAFIAASTLNPASAEALNEIGILYLETKKPKQALKNFKRVLRINEKFPLVHFNLSRVYLLKKNNKSALKEVKAEIKANPKMINPHLLLAKIHTINKDYSQCVGAFQKAIELASLGSQNYIELAKCYRLLGNLDVAMKMLNKSKNLESGNPFVYKELGQLFESRGEVEKAVGAYEQYLVLVPNAPDRKQIKGRIGRLDGP